MTVLLFILFVNLVVCKVFYLVQMCALESTWQFYMFTEHVNTDKEWQKQIPCSVSMTVSQASSVLLVTNLVCPFVPLEDQRFNLCILLWTDVFYQCAHGETSGSFTLAVASFSLLRKSPMETIGCSSFPLRTKLTISTFSKYLKSIYFY
jgi:hypothetical protein